MPSGPSSCFGGKWLSPWLGTGCLSFGVPCSTEPSICLEDDKNVHRRRANPRILAENNREDVQKILLLKERCKKKTKHPKKKTPPSRQLPSQSTQSTKFPSWALGKTTEDWHEDHACQATPEDKGLSHWWLLWCAGGLRRKDENILVGRKGLSRAGLYESYFHIRVYICMSYRHFV